MNRESSNQSGMAIPLILILLTGLTGLAYGALAMARHQLAVARASARHVRSGLAAESGVRMVLGQWARSGVAPATSPEDSAAFAGTLAPGQRYRVTVRRLDSEVYVLEGEGSDDMGAGRRRVGRVVWAADPVERLASFRAAVEHGSGVTLSRGAAVEGNRVSLTPEPWPAAVCASLLPAAATVFPTGSVPPERRYQASGGVDVDGGWAVRMGPVRVQGWKLLSTVSPVDPPPGGAVLTGTCERDSPWAWGSPLDPLGPCAGYFPLVVVEESLIVRAGSGQGVLMVDGDLTLRGAATIFGVVLTAGTLIMSEGTRIVGFVRAGGGVRMDGGATIEASACGALRALRGAPMLHSPFPVPDGAWLDPF